MLMQIKNILRRFGIDLVRYHPFWDWITPPGGFATVLDIGANTGPFSREMRERFPNAHIYAFEPLQDCFAKLEETMRGDERFMGFNFALGEERGETTIHRSSFHPSSSLLPMSSLHKKIYPKSAGSQEELINIKPLDDVAKELTLQKPMLIKFDVQGFEAAVMRGGKNVVSQAQALIIETSFVPLYEGQPLFADIHDLAHSLGFEYHGRRESHYDPATQKPIYEDAVFIKRQGA